MKKIALLCGVLITGWYAQAAAINWTITNVYSSEDSSTKAASGKYSAYLFVTANTSDITTLKTTSLATVKSYIEGKDWTTLESVASVVAKANTADGNWVGATGLSGFSSGSVSAFAIVFDSTSASSSSNYLLVSDGETKTVTFTSAGAAKAFAWGDQTSYTQTNPSWQSVPEPTSGLLLLLGMAGIALKRKRA